MHVTCLIQTNTNDNDNEIIFISTETFTHSYMHDKQWKYGKSRSHGLIYLTFLILTSIYYGSIKSIYTVSTKDEHFTHNKNNTRSYIRP